MLIFAPLRNFTCDAERINLGNNLSMVKFTSTEVKKIETAFKDFLTPAKNEIAKMAGHFHLLREVQVKKTDKASNKAFDEAWTIFNRIINALKLFKRHSVWFDAVYSIDPPMRGAWQGVWLQLEQWPEVSEYKLTKAEVPNFKEWWGKFSNVLHQNKSFKTALQRFTQRTKAITVDYHLVDYIIAFESLFSSGQTESRHKVSRRTAMFLKKKKGDRIEIYKEMKKAYDLRSDIVHGREIKYEEIGKCWDKIGGYLRDCLQKIVEEEQYDRKALLDNLDFD